MLRPIKLLNPISHLQVSEIPTLVALVAAMGAPTTATLKSVETQCEGIPRQVLQDFADGCHRSFVSGMTEEDIEMQTYIFI